MFDKLEGQIYLISQDFCQKMGISTQDLVVLKIMTFYNFGNETIFDTR